MYIHILILDPQPWPCHHLDSSLGLPYPLTVGYVWGRCGVKARADHWFGTSQGSRDGVECNICYSAILDYAYEAYEVVFMSIFLPPPPLVKSFVGTKQGGAGMAARCGGQPAGQTALGGRVVVSSGAHPA